MVGTNEPSAFFGYAEGDAALLPHKAARIRLDTARQDGAEVLEALSFVLGRDVGTNELQRVTAKSVIPELPKGTLNAQRLCAAVAALQPEACILVEEGISTGAFYYHYSPFLKPYTHLTLTGGAIGMGMPVALGAALAAPDRVVINLQADGSAMYTLQTLWSQARERAHVVTVLCFNRRYFTVELECMRAGYTSLSDRAKSLMTLDDPNLDWVGLSRGMGVPAERVHTTEEFADVFQDAIHRPGPFFIEAVLP
jgi:acetolactate synthase-1/2/3 large subunit